MRFGKNPYKAADAYIPKKVTIAILTYIPNLSGYFQQRFDILKLSINSIRKNTDAEYDLLVFDNGSCEQVRSYLNEMNHKSVINILILSDKNLGVLGAFNTIFSAAPGEYIAYSDDDIFFMPGWLDESLQVISTFPNVGMVSALPTWHNFTSRANASDALLAAGHDEITEEISTGWDEQWVKEYCESIGWDIEPYVEKCKEIKVRKITMNNVSAFTTATHCQFLVSKKAMRDILPMELDGKAMKNVGRFDTRLDQKGYLRLSLTQPFVFHIGNNINQTIKNYARQFGIEIDSLPVGEQQSTTTTNPFIIRLLQNKLVIRIINKLNTTFFRWVTLSESYKNHSR